MMNDFTTFYTDNHQRLFNYLIRRCGDTQLAADIVQESFARFWEHYRQYDKPCSLLFTIGRNLLHDHYRHLQKANNHLQEIHDTTTPFAEIDIEHREQYRIVQNAIHSLPAEERDLLSLVVDGGLSYQEISQITGISVASIKVKIHRTRKKLQQILAGETQ